MLTARENAIKNRLVSELGGPASYVARRTRADSIDAPYLELEGRRMKVNKRRAVIFALLYLALSVTAAYVVMVQLGTYNAYLWVAVATFNAVSGAIQYAWYEKRRLACALLDLLYEAGDPAG